MHSVRSALVVVCALIGLPVALAQPVLDGSLGPRPVLTGPDYQIPADLGATRGQNLFHSFSEFNLRAGERATFTGPTGIRNVIARVTGGATSTIDGALRSEVPGASLYFLNPSGVLFGPNSALRVDGSFWVSTADYLRLADGGRFDARTPAASLLTSAPPSAWGFLADRPAPIEFSGARARIASAGVEVGLQAGAGADFGVVAGAIRMGNGTSTDGSTGGAWILNSGGRIVLLAVGSSGDVSMAANPVPELSRGGGPITLNGDAYVQQIDGNGILIQGGQVSLTERAFVGASSSTAANSSAIRIAGERLTLQDRANVASVAFGAAPGPAIELRGIVAVEAIGPGPGQGQGQVLISSIASADGPAGDIRIEGGTIRLSGRTALFGNTEAGGRGPAIRLISDSQIEFAGDSSLVSRVNPNSSGDGGAVRLAATAITLGGGAYIWTVNEGTGRAGDIQIDAANRLQLSGNSFLFGGALSSGAAGRIFINARHVAIDSGSVSASTNGQGAAGQIDIRGSESVQVGPAGSVLSSTSAGGSAGRILVEAPQIMIAGGRLSTGSSTLQNTTGQTGLGGELILVGDTVQITNGALLDSIAQTGGRGGLVQIRARAIEVRGERTGITTTTLGSAQGGNIELEASSDLTLAERASVSAGTSGSGSAGSIRLQAGDRLTLSSGSSIINLSDAGGRAGNIELRAPQMQFQDVVVTSSAASAEGLPRQGGRAGDIVVTADRLVMDVSRIYTTTSSLGAAGSIVIRTGEFQQNGGRIDASTSSSARAGAIDVEARDGFVIGRAALISTLTTADGGAGSIRLSGRSIRITEGALVESTSVGAGDAGNIVIEATNGVSLTEAAVATVARRANGGNITINSPTRVLLLNSAVTASVGGAGNGGNIVIDPQFVILQGNSALTANAVTGDGGNITIRITERGAFLQSPSSIVSASSEFGVDGTVRVEGPARDVSSGLRALDVSYLDASGLVRSACAARRLNTSSSLVLRSGLDGAAGDRQPLPATVFDLVDSKTAVRRPEPAAGSLATMAVECGS